MDAMTGEILKTGGIIGGVASLLLMVGWLIVKGGLVPRIAHDREVKLLQDQITWITADRDGYRAAHDVERQRADVFADQLSLIIEGQKTTVAMLTSINQAAQNAQH